MQSQDEQKPCVTFVERLYDEIVFHRRGLCVSGSAYITNGGSGGMMSLVGLELPIPRISRAKFRDETSRRGK